MQNGTVDAAFATSALPNNAIVELSTMKEIVVVPIDGEGAAALIARYPFYAATMIGDDVYNVPGAGTVAMLATLVCTEDMSEDLVYNITKNLFESKEDLIAGHARGNDIDLEKAKSGVTVDFHPGALKYYEEQGI
jgi:TRAP transporter TAXI family solute receptor